MGTAEDDARAAELKTLVNADERDWRYWVATQLISLNARQADLQANGCARLCEDKGGTVTARWGIPAAAGGGAGVFLLALWEVVKSRFAGGDAP